MFLLGRVQAGFKSSQIWVQGSFLAIGLFEELL